MRTHRISQVDLWVRGRFVRVYDADIEILAHMKSIVRGSDCCVIPDDSGRFSNRITLYE